MIAMLCAMTLGSTACTTTLPLYSWVQAASHTSNVPLTYALNTIIMLISLALTIFSLRILLAGRE